MVSIDTTIVRVSLESTHTALLSLESRVHTLCIIPSSWEYALVITTSTSSTVTSVLNHTRTELRVDITTIPCHVTNHPNLHRAIASNECLCWVIWKLRVRHSVLSCNALPRPSKVVEVYSQQTNTVSLDNRSSVSSSCRLENYNLTISSKCPARVNNLTSVQVDNDIVLCTLAEEVLQSVYALSLSLLHLDSSSSGDVTGALSIYEVVILSSELYDWD